MSRRAAAVRNRLLLGVVLVLVAVALMGWSSDEGLVLLLLALLALLAAAVQGAFGGVAVLVSWLLRYRGSPLTLSQLGDIIGEHDDDMARAGLAVAPPWRRSWLPQILQSRRADLVPRISHRPDGDDVVVTLEAVRAGLSQEELIAALPRLRSAWGVDRLTARPLPGGRRVEFRIHLDGVDPVDGPVAGAAMPGRAAFDEPVPSNRRGGRDGRAPRSRRPPDDRTGRRDGGQAARSARPGDRSRPPDAPPVQIVQGGDPAGTRSRELAVRGRPPRIPPADPQAPWPARSTGLDELDGLDEPGPSTAPIPVGPDRGQRQVRDVDPSATSSRRAPEPVMVREPEPDRAHPQATAQAGSSRSRLDEDQPVPTDVDERSTRFSAIWRTGRDRRTGGDRRTGADRSTPRD